MMLQVGYWVELSEILIIWCEMHAKEEDNKKTRLSSIKKVGVKDKPFPHLNDPDHSRLVTSLVPISSHKTQMLCT